MNVDDLLLFRTLEILLKEALLRADSRFAYFLNPNDPGLVDTLRGISAEMASRSPGPHRKPIVAHANHLLYGLELANRALAGEEGVYEAADWSQAWTLERVSDDDWQDLIARTERAVELLLKQVQPSREWNEIMLTGVFAISPHTAYHLGAIRQLLRELSGG